MRPGTSAIVGRRSSLVAEVHDAEVRLERRERVVGDLRRRGGDRGEQRRLAGVRQPDQADVGDQPELEPDPALLARARPSGRAWAPGGSRSRSGCCRARPARRARPSPSGRRRRGRRAARPSRRRRRPCRAGRRGSGRRRPCRAGARASPRPPAVARKWCLYWKSRSVVWPGSTRRWIEPPRPPSPPSGPPRGTCASRRKVAAPSPPSPARTQIFTRSRNIRGHSSHGDPAAAPRRRSGRTAGVGGSSSSGAARSTAVTEPLCARHADAPDLDR